MLLLRMALQSQLLKWSRTLATSRFSLKRVYHVPTRSWMSFWALSGYWWPGIEASHVRPQPQWSLAAHHSCHWQTCAKRLTDLMLRKSGGRSKEEKRLQEQLRHIETYWEHISTSPFLSRLLVPRRLSALWSVATLLKIYALESPQHEIHLTFHFNCGI